MMLCYVVRRIIAKRSSGSAIRGFAMPYRHAISADAPVVTKRGLLCDVCIGAGLGLAGDYICQTWVEGEESLDTRRMFALSSFGAIYTGALSHLVYPWYTIVVIRHFPSIFSRSSFGLGIGASILDNFIHNPIFYIPAFYLYTDTVKGVRLEDAVLHLKNEWLEVFETCFAIWVPLQVSHRQHCTFVGS